MVPTFWTIQCYRHAFSSIFDVTKTYIPFRTVQNVVLVYSIVCLCVYYP